MAISLRFSGESFRARSTPAILHDEHALEYAAILEEIPASPGVQLWRILRGVTLWISTPVEARRGLFSGAGMGLAEVPEAIREALDTLQVVIRSSADDQRRLVPACVQVSEWAERQGYLGTALAYAQGCALADPDNPELACRVGRLALEHAEYTRADSWYRRALALARRSRSWDTYGLCFIGLGNQNRQRGRLPAAEQYFRHAPARAKQDRRSMLAAMADHDPYALALRRGHIERAEQYARRARGQYPPEDPHLFRLATDVALLLDPVLDHLRPVPHLAEVAVPPPDQIETPVAELRDHCSSGERARLAHAVVGIL